MKTARQAFIALAALAPLAAAADDSALLNDRFFANIGYFYPTISTTARIDGTQGRGTDVNLEDDLGLERHVGSPWVELVFRLGERWRIEAEYFDLRRSKTTSVSRTIQIQDTVYQAGVTLDTESFSTIYRLSVGYSFLKTPSGELGAVLGVYATDFGLSVAGSGSFAGGGINAAAGSTTQSETFLAPLPTIGLYGIYAFSPAWAVFGRVDYFGLNSNGYSGSLTNVNAGVQWQFARHFGAALSFRYVDYNLSVDRSNFHGDVNYKFYGPMASLTASF